MAFFGWFGGRLNGRMLGSDDGENWRHLSATSRQMPDATGAAGGGGAVVAGATVWSGIYSSQDLGASFTRYRINHLLEKGRGTHHMRAAWGDYDGGRFVVVGDNGPLVFYSKDRGTTWAVSDMKGVAPQENPGYGASLVFGNDVFLLNFGRSGTIARSANGGQTWTMHDSGLSRSAYAGLSFVGGEFWLTSDRGGARASEDGVTWRNLAESTPPGRFARSDCGTFICVHRQSQSILRSEDGKTWTNVLKTDGIDSADRSYRFVYVIYGKVQEKAH
jgi:photosystem II stability/assembly factor-like uncharacterized protein